MADIFLYNTRFIKITQNVERVIISINFSALLASVVGVVSSPRTHYVVNSGNTSAHAVRIQRHSVISHT